MAPYSLLFKHNISIDELEEMSYRELQQRCKALHLPANFKKIYLIKLIHGKINGKDEHVTRIINQAKYERLQAASARKKKRQQIFNAMVIPTTQGSPPLTVTPKKGNEVQSIRPITLNMSERVLRNRMETSKYIRNNESNRECFASRDNPNESSKIQFRTSGLTCGGILVPRKIRRTGIPEFKEQLKSLQPIIVTRKNELQMLCKEKCSTMEIVLRSVHSKSIPSQIENSYVAKNKINDKKVTVGSFVSQKRTANGTSVHKNGQMSNHSLLDSTHCNNQTALNPSNNKTDINYNMDSHRNEGNKKECNDMNNFPNLQATFEEQSVVPPKSSNCLTSIEVRTLNERTPTCNYFVNNNHTDVVTPVSTRSFVADYLQNLNNQLDIYFNPRNIKPLCTNTVKLNVMNKNSILYTGMISGLVTPTFTLPCRPITSIDVVEKRASYYWNLQFLQPHDILLYQPQDLYRESCGIMRNPLCILASQVATRTEKNENSMDDVLEVISQDGDYLSRLGMNVKVKCVFCAWESTKIQFDHHLRKDHSDLIQAHKTVECIISFNLEQLVNSEDWLSILIEDHLGFLYIVGGKLHKLDYLLVSVAAVTKEQENKEVSVTAYNKQTMEPCVWYGEVQDFTMVDMNDANAHIKIDLSRLDIVISGIHEQRLMLYSPSEPLDPSIVLYVKI